MKYLKLWESFKEDYETSDEKTFEEKIVDELNSVRDYSITIFDNKDLSGVGEIKRVFKDTYDEIFIITTDDDEVSFSDLEKWQQEELYDIVSYNVLKHLEKIEEDGDFYGDDD